MKTLLRLLLGLCVSASLTARVFAESDEPKLSPEEIEKLVSPIALYPDSLVALILPASTASSDVVLAARFFAGGGEQSDIDKQFWAESVKSLAHYPDVIKWMDDNLQWSQQMGEIFTAQPADVMTAIQRLRAHAYTKGLLENTPQQRVVTENEVIYIMPADPRVIYVPRYDPEILWMRRSWSGSFISFGLGFGIGNWLYYDCDWPRRSIWVHNRHPGWVYAPGWRPPSHTVRVNVVHEWRPDPRFHHARPRGHRPPSVAIHPRPFGPEHHFAPPPHQRDNRPSHNVHGINRGPTPPPHVTQQRPVGHQPREHNNDYRGPDRPQPPAANPPRAWRPQPQPQSPQQVRNERDRPHQTQPPAMKPPAHAPSRERPPAPAQATPPAARPVPAPAKPSADSENSTVNQPQHPRIRGH
ncbi:MAG: DUF3300 domain-containing protein [Verrucomicrobia bacterium]|nr:DUF3300 domain-containing protein [Verrucomicrobiota bacterium]